MKEFPEFVFHVPYLVYSVVSGKISLLQITLNTLGAGKIDYRNVYWLEWIQDKDLCAGDDADGLSNCVSRNFVIGLVISLY
jgi:hypothetical protein